MAAKPLLVARPESLQAIFNTKLLTAYRTKHIRLLQQAGHIPVVCP